MPRGTHDIIVYADWKGLDELLKLGYLHSHAHLQSVNLIYDL